MFTELKLRGPAGMELDPNRRTLTVGGAPIRLARREMDLLSVLLEDRGRVIPFEELAQRAWGYSPAGDTRFIYTAVWRLRRTLASQGVPEVIEGTRGVGYSIPDDDGYQVTHHRGQVVIDLGDPKRPLVMASESTAELRASGIFDFDGDAQSDLRLSPRSEAEAQIRGTICEAIRSGTATLSGLRWVMPDASVAVLDGYFSLLQAPDGSSQLLADMSWRQGTEEDAVPPATGDARPVDDRCHLVAGRSACASDHGASQSRQWPSSHGPTAASNGHLG